MKGLYTVLLLIVSNVFMTFAWYGHLKLQDEDYYQLAFVDDYHPFLEHCSF